MAKDNPKLIISALKSGKEMKVSLRDMLTIQQYAESVGLKVEVVGRDKDQVTIKAVSL